MRREHSLTVAISSRALFDLDESNRVFEERGLEAYRKYQIEHEDEVLEPGDAFPLVKKLININKILGKNKVDVILLSRNSADTGLRIFNSIRAHGLDIQRAAFGGGADPYRYVRAFDCDLFLSTVAEDVAQGPGERRRRGHHIRDGLVGPRAEGAQDRVRRRRSRILGPGGARLPNLGARCIHRQRGGGSG